MNNQNDLLKLDLKIMCTYLSRHFMGRDKRLVNTIMIWINFYFQWDVRKSDADPTFYILKTDDWFCL